MSSDDRAGVRQRIQQLVDERSQSEIARRTGVSAVSVSRYLKGTRVPSDFCSALVRTLDVNPAWLLLGEGTPYLSDITGETGAMAGNVLELVEAMNAVARMRLGALTGKHHLRMLRELNDALLAYEELRVRLNKQSAPIFRRLLNDLRIALTTFKMERADDLHKAAEQVGRLCDDPELHRDMLVLQAHHEFLRGNEAGALELQRTLIRHPLVAGTLTSQAISGNIYRMVLTLDTLGRLPEALRICNAALALADDDSSQWPDVAAIKFLRGRLIAKLGDLNTGLGIMLRQLPLVSDALQRAVRLWVMPYMLFATTLRPHEAFEYGDHISVKAYLILRYASWFEDEALLVRAHEYLQDPRLQTIGDVKAPSVYETLVLRALRDKDKAVLKACPKAVEHMYHEDRGTPEVYPTQLMRLLGMKAQARKELLKAGQAVAARAAESPLDVVTLAIHYRNALLLIDRAETGEFGKLRSAAVAHFEDRVAHGFHCFASLLEAAAGHDPAHNSARKAGNRS